MLLLSSLFLNSSFAAPVLVAKTLGLSKISESYQISEELIEALNKQYEFDSELLVENPCIDVSCQRDTASSNPPLWMVHIIVAEDKKSAKIILFDIENQRERNTKIVKGESWDEVRTKLPTSLIKVSKRRFSSIKVETDKSAAPSSPETSDDSSTQASQWYEEKGEEGAEGAEGAENPIVEAPKKEYLLQPDTPAFAGLRARGTGNLGMYTYNQSAKEATEYISPDVSLLTLLPALRVSVEYWLPNNQIGVFTETSIAPFGYTLGDDSSIKTISNIRAGFAYHHPLAMGTLEVGLAYHKTNGMGFRFSEERTKVDATTQSITGGALSIGLVRRMMDMDVRMDISETFTPLPEQTRIRLLAEKPISVLPVGGMMLTAHGGIQCTMRHFGFEVQTETGSVFDLQAGVFGGAGVSF